MIQLSDKIDPSDKGHNLLVDFIMEDGVVIIRTRCKDCETILDKKVLYEVPQSIIKDRCLPSIIKKV